MRAVRLRGGALRLEEMPEPVAGPGEVVVDVAAVSVCASDVHYVEQGGIGGLVPPDGFLLGHEVSGVIVAVGPGVSPERVGERVAIEPGRSCGECRECVSGAYNLCRQMAFFGTPPTDGALCDRVVCDARLAFPLPESLTLAEGALMEPLSVGIYSAEQAGIRPGETAVVLGCGAVGLSALQALRVYGAERVWALDLLPGRVELAWSLGAAPGEPPEGGVDVAVECAGTPEAVTLALELARPGGRVVVVGIPDVDEVRVPAALARRKGLTLHFLRRYRNCFPHALEWTAQGQINVKPYLTHRFPLEQTPEAFRLAATRADGVIRAWIAVS
ncbi:MAG TPA: alcohol dehydrogenase catalytic domain-containing protein [Armatimonadota bacterium]|jgi:L-iditol 2-dehydrogenase